MAPPAAKHPITIKHFIMAALTAILAAAVVITIVVVVLSPARIIFSITDAASTTTGHDIQLTLTVAANNTSRRTRVEYRSIFIDVSNNTGPQREDWVRANTKKGLLPLRQPTRNVSNIYAVVPLAGNLWRDDINETRSFKVMITALARFKVRIVPSRLYEIKVSCSNIIFLPKEANNQSGGAPVAAPPTIECVSGQ